MELKCEGHDTTYCFAEVETKPVKNAVRRSTMAGPCWNVEICQWFGVGTLHKTHNRALGTGIVANYKPVYFIDALLQWFLLLRNLGVASIQHLLGR